MLIFCILSLLFHPYGVLLVDYLIRGLCPCLCYSTPDGGYFNAFKVLFSDFFRAKIPEIYTIFLRKLHKMENFSPLNCTKWKVFTPPNCTKWNFFCLSRNYLFLPQMTQISQIFLLLFFWCAVAAQDALQIYTDITRFARSIFSRQRLKDLRFNGQQTMVNGHLFLPQIT